MSRFRSLPAAAAAAVLLAAVAARTAPAQDAAAAAEKARADIQKKLAARTDPKAGDLLKLVRVDKFTADDGKVVAQGVFLNPGPPDADQKKGPGAGNDKADRPASRADHRADLVKSLTAVVREAVNDPTLTVVWAGLEPDPADQPHRRLRAAAAARQLDQSLFDGRYDDRGRFVLTGLVGRPAADWLAAELRALRDDPRLDRALTPPGGAKELVDDVKRVDWKLTPEDAQKALATAPDFAAAGRLRIDRVYPTYDGLNLRIKVDGLRLGERAIDPAPDRPGMTVEKVLIRAWPELFAKANGGALGVDTSGLEDLNRAVLDPDRSLQAAVAADRELDGTRIDRGVRFDAAGRVALGGVRPAVAGDAARRWEAALAARLTAALAAEAAAGGERAGGYKDLLRNGVTTADMKPFPAARVLADLRAWAADADELEDVRLSRLYFDPRGTAQLVGSYVVDKDRASIEAKFVELAGGFLKAVPPPAPPKGAAPNPADQKPADKADEPAAGRAAPGRLLVVAHLADEPPPPFGFDKLQQAKDGFTAYLRERLKADPKEWEGVVIERGYFDRDDRYAVRGLADKPEQTAKLNALIDAARGDPRWEPYFQAQRHPVTLDVMPMAGLLDRARRVAPGYPALDGFTPVGVGYDKDFNLVFRVGQVGYASPDAVDAARNQLQALLEASRARTGAAREPGTTHWGRRLPRGKAVVLDRPGRFTPVNAALAGEAAPLAAELLVRHLGPAPTAPPVWCGRAGGCGPVVCLLLAVAPAVLPPADPGRAEFLARARGWLDAARPHGPDGSAGWFLSGCLHYLAGDGELAARDFDRAIRVEGHHGEADPAAWARRHELTAGVQGELRHHLEAFVNERRRALAAGAGSITFDVRR